MHINTSMPWNGKHITQNQAEETKERMHHTLILKPLEELCLQPLFLVPLFLSLIFLCKLLKKRKCTTLKYPPFPPKLPIIGNLHQVTKPLHYSLQTLSKKYGEFMLLQLGSRPTLVVSSANAAREIMKTHDLTFSNRPKSIVTEKLLYNGRDIALCNYGEYWRQMKSICVLKLLSNARVRSFRTIRKEETALMVEKIKQARTSVFNLSEIVMTLASDVLCRAAFGRKYSGDKGRDFVELLRKFAKLFNEFSARDSIPWLGWLDKMNGLESRLHEVSKEFDAFLEEILKEHQDNANNEGRCDGIQAGEKVKDFVDVLLEVQKDATLALPIDRESIKAIILDMFAAGTDTSSTLLEWSMSELLRHPQALKELQREVRRFATGKTNVDESDLDKMEYLRAVIKETLRLHPPVPLLLFRESTQDVKVNGYHIAARTQVITNAWAIHRDPTIWKEPNDFKPERFLTSSVDFKGLDFELIPFGAGRRGCPGIQFATINTELVLANLIYAFDWELPGGVKGETLDMTENSGINVHRQDPLFVVATPYTCK